MFKVVVNSLYVLFISVVEDMLPTYLENSAGNYNLIETKWLNDINVVTVECLSFSNANPVCGNF